MKKTKIYLMAFSVALFVSCESEVETTDIEVETMVSLKAPEPRFVELPQLPDMPKVKGDNSNKSMSVDYGYAIYMAEYIMADGSNEMGNTVFFSDRGNKQLTGDFVPALSLDGKPNITYYVDNNRPSDDLSDATTEAAIDRAMGTWDDLTCSELGMTKVPFDGRPTGLVSLVFGFGGSPDYVADVTHSGWLPKSFFDFLAPDGGNGILGVAFTIVFQDENGETVDTDNNGKFDVAWREIYYNDNFLWADGTTFDVETVALHEAGHGLSQAHFGSAFRSGGNGKLHFSPRAVMNATYSGVQTDIAKTDNAGHCSNWSQWPNN